MLFSDINVKNVNSPQYKNFKKFKNLYIVGVTSKTRGVYIYTKQQ